MNETPDKHEKTGREMPLPGVAAISFYLLLIAGLIIVGVVNGGHYPAAFLFFPVFFIAASAGLLARFRWAWALALAAVFLLSGYNFWVFSSTHSGAAAVQGALNLLFFFYLIRPEVRSQLR